MEIDIPDLDDIKFSNTCDCMWRYSKNERPDPNCAYCHGTSRSLTGAGEELIRFLKEHFGLVKEG